MRTLGQCPNILAEQCDQIFGLPVALPRIGLLESNPGRKWSIAPSEAVVSRLDNPAWSKAIGCGDPTLSETFFSGMIDDVRIYNRAVHP
jgi:hypothetical protein